MKTPVDKKRIALAVRDFQSHTNRDQSFRVIFDQYYDIVQSFFAQRVFSLEDRLDLTQETFLRVYKGLEGYRREADFGTWLFRIAFNTHLKWLGRHHVKEISLDQQAASSKVNAELNDNLERGQPVARQPRQTPLDDTLERERQRKLRRAIAGLPDQMRRCTQMRVYQDLSYREIALCLKLSIDTVKVHLFQARKKLKRTLRSDFEDLGWQETPDTSLERPTR